MNGVEVGRQLGTGTGLEFVLVGTGDPEYEGRARIRSTVLGLRPVSEDAGRASARRAPGVTWKLVAPNGVTMAMRARDFRDAEEARADVDRLAGHVALRALTVEDPLTGRRSFWVMERGRILVVSLRLVPPTRRSMLRLETERVLRALRAGRRGTLGRERGGP